MENFNVEFAKRMEIVVKRLGSVSELARRVDVAYPTATKWVKEGAEPSTTNLIKIADASQVNLLWLATGQGAPYLEGEQSISDELEQEGQRILQEQLKKTDQIVKSLQEARRISRIGVQHQHSEAHIGQHSGQIGSKGRLTNATFGRDHSNDNHVNILICQKHIHLEALILSHRARAKLTENDVSA